MNPSELRRDPEAGFSLVEVSISIVILVLGLMSLGLAMTMAYREGRASDERKIAREWAMSQLEAIRSMNFKDLKLDPTEGGYVVPTDWTNYKSFGEHGDTESPTDSEPDWWVRYYYSTTKSVSNGSVTMDLKDELLNGLNPPSGTDWKFVTGSAGQTTTDVPVGQVYFEDPSSHGMVENDGLWVTVRVSWNGVLGNQVLDFHTLVVRR